MKSKFRLLKAALRSDDLTFIMEAHNGISAKIVEKTGFKAIWASGLAISTAFGIRDRNEASWTQVMEVVEFMSDGTSIPILLDGDTGYGDANNVARLVRKLCQRDIAGLCIEDKAFPKRNSFLDARQSLVSIADFVAKISAAKDAQTDPDFSIVSRIEVLIAGGSMQEALDRAAAYHEAGTDAIVIHSKKSNADEIQTFCKAWNNTCPVIVIPTKYFATPTQLFRDLEISAVIWANHGIRASISAIADVYRQIYNTETIAGVEHCIAKLGDIFELTEEQESTPHGGPGE